MDKQPSGTNYILILSVRGGSQLVGVYVGTVWYLPHCRNRVITCFWAETIYLLNFVGWTCVALVPTKWQGFYSNNSKLVLGNIFQDTRESLLSNEILEAYVAKPISQITVLGECFIPRQTNRSENEFQKFIPKWNQCT